MCEEPAFAHAELLGERANGETLKALRGGDVDGTSEYSFACAEAFRLPAEDLLTGMFVDTLFDYRFEGTRAKSARHEITVTQGANKHERSFNVVCSSA